jgi:hypothetical protein
MQVTSQPGQLPLPLPLPGTPRGALSRLYARPLASPSNHSLSDGSGRQRDGSPVHTPSPRTARSPLTLLTGPNSRTSSPGKVGPATPQAASGCGPRPGAILVGHRDGGTAGIGTMHGGTTMVLNGACPAPSQAQAGTSSPRSGCDLSGLPLPAHGTSLGAAGGAGTGAAAGTGYDSATHWQTARSESPAALLPLIPITTLRREGSCGVGAFGEVYRAFWSGGRTRVAVKANGLACTDTAAIENERALYELLLVNPHPSVLPVYGICTDAPDGRLRLVMRVCEKGSLFSLLVEQRWEVRGHVSITMRACHCT